MRATIPQSPESECAVLGSILLEPKMMLIAKSSLKAEAFHLLAHRSIYEMMLQLDAEHTAIDCISLSEKLRAADLTATTGGMTYLMKLMETPGSALNCPVYIGEVNRQFYRRLGILKAHEIKSLLQHDRLPDGTAVGDGLDYIAKSNGHYSFSKLLTEGLDGGSHPTAMSEVETEVVNWVWNRWLPEGKFVTMSGDPGIFKSGITIDIIARLTTGRPMPLCELPCEKRNCLLFVSEDGLADTVKPRLLAAGADVSRVWAYTTLDMVELDLLLVEREIKEKEIGFVVIDVMNSFIPSGADSQTSAALRRELLAPLVRLAEQYRCTILALFHLNKMQSVSNAVYRSTGRLDFVAVARAAIVCGKDPSEEGHFVMARAKGNLSEEPPALRYHIDEDSEYRVPVVRWDGIAVGQDASSILSAPGKDASQEKTQTDFAILFLLELLEGGAVAAKEVRAEAEKAGVAWRTLERVKPGLIKTPRIGGTGVRGSGYWAWQLLPEEERDAAMQARVDRLQFKDALKEEEPEDREAPDDDEMTPRLFNIESFESQEEDDESGS